jgi:hypothetical protein
MQALTPRFGQYTINQFDRNTPFKYNGTPGDSHLIRASNPADGVCLRAHKDSARCRGRHGQVFSLQQRMRSI